MLVQHGNHNVFVFAKFTCKLHQLLKEAPGMGCTCCRQHDFLVGKAPVVQEKRVATHAYAFKNFGARVASLFKRLKVTVTEHISWNVKQSFATSSLNVVQVSLLRVRSYACQVRLCITTK